MATRPKLAKGWGLICPHCGGSEEALVVDLNDLGSIRCDACSEEFSAEDAIEATQRKLDRWVAVAEWISRARTISGDL